nr:pentalenene synthase [Streptomyces chartreusis]
MPQDLNFPPPIQPQINPEIDRARERHLGWAATHNLIRGDVPRQRYVKSYAADLSAYAYPRAAGADFDLSFDMMGWFFLFDDQFDVPSAEHPWSATSACTRLISVLLQPSTADISSLPPIAGAFVDMWQRMRYGMSQAWIDRTTCNWVDYLLGNLTEASNRLAEYSTSSIERMRIRRRTIGVRPSIDMSERVNNFEIPDIAWHSTHIEAMRLITIDHIILTNELASLEIDEARHDPNLVYCLMREKGLSRAEAIGELASRADNEMERFLDLERRLPFLGERLALSKPEMRKIKKYVEALRAWIRGSYDWHCVAGRYSAEVAKQASPLQFGYLNSSDLSV